MADYTSDLFDTAIDKDFYVANQYPKETVFEKHAASGNFANVSIEVLSSGHIEVRREDFNVNQSLIFSDHVVVRAATGLNMANRLISRDVA